MATHAIGNNNALIGVCVKKPVKAIIGQLATQEDRSMASLLWHNAMENIRRINPEMAAKIAAASVQLLVCAGVCVQLLCSDDLLTRRLGRRWRRQEIGCLADLMEYDREAA